MPRLRTTLLCVLIALTGCTTTVVRRAAPAALTNESIPGVRSEGSPTQSAGAPAGRSLAPGAPAPSADTSDATAARQALDGFLSAFTHLDGKAALRFSAGGPTALVAVQSTVASFNSSFGGHTTLTLSDEHFSPARVDDMAATLTGSVTLTIAVSGPRGHVSSRDTISGPVQVVHDVASWQVVGFTYDGQPLVFVREDARQVEDGVELDVGSVLSYGAETAAAVAVASPGSRRNVALSSTQLKGGGSAVSGHGLFVNSPAPSALLLYPRVSGTPTELDAAFRSGPGSTIQFSVPLAGQPA